MKSLTTLLQPHPDPQLQRLWNLLQVSVLLLPLSSLLGGVGCGFTALGIWLLRWRTIVHRPLNRGFAVLAGLLLLSALFADRKVEAGLGLFNFLPFFWAFAGFAELIQTTAQLRRLAWLVVIPSVPVLLLGFGQQFLQWDIQITSGIITWSIPAIGNPPGRMSSVFFYATVLAAYLLIVFSLTLGLLVKPTIRRTRSRHARLQRLFLGLVLTATAIGLVFANSRNAWALAAIVGLAFAFYRGWRWLVGAVALVVGAVLGAAFAPSPLRDGLRQIVPAFFWARLTDQLYPDRPLAELRSTQWQFALSLVQQRPLLGWGLRNFEPLYWAKYQFYIGHPHNLPLMLACETGIPAMLLFLGLVGWVVAHGCRLLHHWNHPSTGDRFFNESSGEASHAHLLFTFLVTFMGCALFSLLDVVLFDLRVNLLGWLLLAAICGLVYHADSDSGSRL